MMFGPVRPTAFMTIMSENADLERIQLTLYSIQSTLVPLRYKPEMVVLATSNISNKTRKELMPFCTRVINIKPLLSNEANVLHCWGMTAYSTIIYIEKTCLVLKDLGYMFPTCPSERGDVLAVEGCDGVPKSFTDASMVVLKPNARLFDELMSKLNSDDKESALNKFSAAFSTARILSNSYDTKLVPLPPKLSPFKKIIRVRHSEKEWGEVLSGESCPPAFNDIETILVKWRRGMEKTTLKLEKVKGIEKNEKLQHIRISKRFKELRKLGIDTKFAMEKAREENLHVDVDDAGVGKQVGAMFGAM
mmetsp:Transcript_28865/g.44894  ORF Transcript_28865/g.44894 Transcript_28865/m.44894 type:complete len:305 (-) Transcript_28865:174-1088(-)